MLESHWLDEVFDDPDNARETLHNHPKLEAAFKAAEQAYRQHQSTAPATGKPISGPSAQQEARQAFLNELELEPQAPAP